MMKRIVLWMMILAMSLSLLAGCKTAEEDFSASGSIDREETDTGTEKEDQTSSDPTEKDPSQKEETPSEKEEDSTTDHKEEKPKEETKPNEDPKEETKPNSSAPAVDLTLNSLQDAAKGISLAKGETLWFGPVSISQEEVLTFTEEGGKKTVLKRADAKETDSFGNYRLYSYTAAAAGTVTLSIHERYANYYLASKGQEMTLMHLYYYWDSKNQGNLYSGALDLSGKTMDWKGKLSSSSDYDLTHAIAVKEGDTLTFGPARSNQVVQGFGMDANGKASVLINANGLTENASFPKGMKIYTYQVPAGVSQVHLNVSADVSGKFMVTKNKIFTLSDYQATTGIAADTLPDPLKGLAGLFAGDSVNHGLYSRDEMATTFKDGKGGWAPRIERDTGLIATNMGQSGFLIADYPAGSTDRSICSLLEPNKKKDYDFIVMDGGVNDMSKNIAIGSITDSFDPDDFDTSTYAGGLERTFYDAVCYYGDTAAIGYIFIFKIIARDSHNKDMTPYYSVAKEICKKWGVTYLDLYTHEKLNADLKFDTKEHTNDLLHPDASGYELITPYVIEYMRTMTPCPQEVLAKCIK